MLVALGVCPRRFDVCPHTPIRVSVPNAPRIVRSPPKTHQDTVRMNHHRVNSMPNDNPIHEKKPSVVSPKNACSSCTAPKAPSNAQKLVNAR